jgi:hypothetical protein
LAPAIAQSR